jgi:hypothetical protein
MYLMDPETPRELYAELVRTRQQDRAARRARCDTPASPLRNAWRRLVRRATGPQSFSELAES